MNNLATVTIIKINPSSKLEGLGRFSKRSIVAESWRKIETNQMKRGISYSKQRGIDFCKVLGIMVQSRISFW
jgi:hypothetical protein